VGNEHLAGLHEHRSGFNRSLIVTDPLIKPNEHLAGFLSNDGGFIVGPSKLRMASKSSKKVKDTNSVSSPTVRRSSRAPRNPGSCRRVAMTSER
jgi:hypothetical protein